MPKRFFGTDGIRGTFGMDPITPDFALKLGLALGHNIAKRAPHKPKVLIGKDTRRSGAVFEGALEAGLLSSGVDTCRLGVLPTPGVAYLTQKHQADVGIVISASHNPACDNGFKFFNTHGKKLGDDIEHTLEHHLSSSPLPLRSSDIGTPFSLTHPQQQYQDHCQSMFPKPLSLQGLHIVVDSAHGAGTDIFAEILRRLGAKVDTLGDAPNGDNINQGCGSLYPQALIDTQKQLNADIGLALDGDGDRLLVTDEQFERLDGDEILYILAKARLQAGTLCGGVVGTLMSNLGLERALKQLKIPFVRTKVGDRYVCDELYQRGWQLGGETSGHIICLEQATTGDAIMAALNILAQKVLTQKSLSELKQGMMKFDQVLLNVKTQTKDVIQTDHVRKAIESGHQSLAGKGRILLRPSGTEPLIRVMVEGEDPCVNQQVAKALVHSVEQACSRA